MVDAKELRLNNYILVGERPSRVLAIRQKIVETESGDISHKYLRGVDLSVELLELCGLVRGVNNEYFIGRFNLRSQDDKWEIYIQGNDTRFHWITDIHFLHELQNLVYIFLNKELPITAINQLTKLF